MGNGGIPFLRSKSNFCTIIWSQNGIAERRYNRIHALRYRRVYRVYVPYKKRFPHVRNFVCFRKSCELFYKKNPLKIVRGRAQYLYDQDGREYLDCINNVAHGTALRGPIACRATLYKERIYV